MARLLDSISSILDKVLGPPLRSSEASKEELTVATGVPALGLDALASTAYGPEALLAILIPLGAAGAGYMPLITLAILALLATLYMSYRQTAAAYPDGGGSYIVAKDNLGIRSAVVAGASLMIDYILNVAVGISAGIGAVLSAIPALHAHTLSLCLVVLVALTIINLRGVRESGVIFAFPVAGFLLCVGAAVGIGLVRSAMAGGHPQPVVAPPALPPGTEAVSLWLLLRAFASGCTAMTGVEAVSNGVPLFQQPAVPKAQWTLTIIVGILGLFLLAVSHLSPAYHLHAMDERAPGYQTLLSQLVAAVAGRGIFYYISIATIFLILACSAQTSYADFPRVCRLLADDGFLPLFFANRGRRLAYSAGIIVLSILSGLLLIAFDGVTDALIPLYAIGAFGAFLFSQAGMVVHWKRKGAGGINAVKLAVNAIGAVATGIALVILVLTKFAEGAWITLAAGPGLVWLFWKIRRHYDWIGLQADHPMKLQVWKLQAPVVIVPVHSWNCVSETAVRFSLEMSDDITAVHVCGEEEDNQRLRGQWAEYVEKPARAAGTAVPRLVFIESPYRQIFEPVLKYVRDAAAEHKDRLIAVVIPELVEPHWYGYLLHNLHAAGLKASLFLDDNPRIVVITTPWRLKDKS